MDESQRKVEIRDTPTVTTEVIYEPPANKHTCNLPEPEGWEVGTIVRCNCERVYRLHKGDLGVYGMFWYRLGTLRRIWYSFWLKKNL